MSVETLTATHLAPPKSVPFYEYAKTGVRNFAVTLTRENPLLWSLTTGRHVQADMEGEYLCKQLFCGRKQSNQIYDVQPGPYYLTGTPDRQVTDGKAVMASADLLKR